MNLSKEERQEIMSLVADIIDAAEMKGYHSHPTFGTEFDVHLNKSVAKLDTLLKDGMTDLEKMLICQLQSCVNHLEHARRHTVSTNSTYDDAIAAANKVLSEVAYSHPHVDDSDIQTITRYT